MPCADAHCDFDVKLATLCLVLIIISPNILQSHHVRAKRKLFVVTIAYETRIKTSIVYIESFGESLAADADKTYMVSILVSFQNIQSL